MQNVNIKAVAQITGINENTLRAWERRYTLLDPKRADDGRRSYSKKDIEKLVLLGKLVQGGHQISRIAKLSWSQLKKLEHTVYKITEESKPHDFTAVKPSTENTHLSNIITALKSFDLNAINRSLQKAKFELSPKAIVSELILPLLRHVGTLVMDSELSISQEHLLSSLLRDYLGTVYQSLSPYEYSTHTSKEKVLLTTREGDLHEFSILLSAIICRVHGNETYYLGPNMPADDLAIACHQFNVSTVVLGLADLPSDKEFISAYHFLKKLDQLLPKKISIVCGGSSMIQKNPISSGRKFLTFSTIEQLDKYFNKPI